MKLHLCTQGHFISVVCVFVTPIIASFFLKKFNLSFFGASKSANMWFLMSQSAVVLYMNLYTFSSFPKYQRKTSILHFTLGSSNQSCSGLKERILL